MKFSRVELRMMYQTMLTIRKVEEKVAELYPEQEIRCPVHFCIGQEAIATGVCLNLRKDDYLVSNHRGHGHYIAKGGNLNAMMAELYGRATGCSKGKGGSMHLVDPEVNVLGTTSIVGGVIPIATGAALGAVMQGDKRVVAAFFGDGAADEGVFYESLNFASLKKLPVIFVCENNFYAVHSHQSARQPPIDIFKRAESFGMPGVGVDGTNVIAVYEAARKAVQRARAGEGPTLIECKAYRWRAHAGPEYDYELGYRTKEELDEWMQRCPIKTFGEDLLAQGLMSEVEMKQISQQIDREIEIAIIFAKESPFPDESELMKDILAPGRE